MLGSCFRRLVVSLASDDGVIGSLRLSLSVSVSVCLSLSVCLSVSVSSCYFRFCFLSFLLYEAVIRMPLLLFVFDGCCCFVYIFRMWRSAELPGLVCFSS